MKKVLGYLVLGIIAAVALFYLIVLITAWI